MINLLNLLLNLWCLNLPESQNIHNAHLSGTYFNCIMFMVASSVVTTIMILNYHHRLSDTHKMPNWVMENIQTFPGWICFSTCFLLQVRILFLQWIPWLLRMSRPGEKITRKTILIQNKMKEMDMKENSSKSLLANVLDMDDDFRPSPLNHHVFPQTPHLPKSSQPNTASSLFR